jgi:hypothetical protein
LIKSSRKRRAEQGAGMEKRNTRRNLAGTPEGNRIVERPRRRCENNNKMDLREMNLRDPYNVGTLLSKCATGSWLI